MINQETPIAINSTSIKLTLLDCYYNQISSTQEGGCISYISNGIDSSICLCRVVARNCQTESTVKGSFMYVECDGIFHMIDTSLDQCPASFPDAFYTIYSLSGQNIISGGNATRCKALSDFFYLYSSSISSFLSYIHFESNIINQHAAIVIVSYNNTIKNAAFINNVQNYNREDLYVGIVYALQCSLDILNSYFVGNPNRYFVSTLKAFINVRYCVFESNKFYGNVTTFSITNSGTKPLTRIVNPIKKMRVSCIGIRKIIMIASTLINSISSSSLPFRGSS